MNASRESPLGSERPLRTGSTVIVITVTLIKVIVITLCPDAKAAPTGKALGSVSRWAYQVDGSARHSRAMSGRGGNREASRHDKNDRGRHRRRSRGRRYARVGSRRCRGGAAGGRRALPQPGLLVV